VTTGQETLDEFAAQFDEEPGYLNFARVGPIGETVRAEQLAMTELLAKGRFGTIEALDEQDERVRAVVARLTGFRPDQVVFQPSTSAGILQAIFGITGGIAMAPSEFPSMPFAAVRAQQAMGRARVEWLDTRGGGVTPGVVREQLTDETLAVAVSLVDYRTGYLADIEGIRQVIGDRLLIVDAIQGFGVVDAPFEVADVVASGGQKWTRAGWGTGFLALSDKAIDRIAPVLSGFPGSEVEGEPVNEVPPPARAARAFAVSNPDPIAQARFAAALEEIERVGVETIRGRVLERSARIIAMADENGIQVTSSRADSERAGIVVVEPPEEQLTVLTASLHNHGVSVATRQGSVRLSAHVSTSDDTLDMVRESFVTFAAATIV
jgi:selenocysteine lyase/cysteine desulfurase